MKTSITAVFLAFSLFLATPATVFAASTTSVNRYFIPTTRAIWRTAFSARHVFSDGFTANLSDLQVRLARFAGFKPIPVKRFNILEDLEDVSIAAPTEPTPQTVPSQSVPWSVRAMLGDAKQMKTAGGNGVKVAVIDTGIDREHPDLESRITGCFDLTDVEEGFLDDTCDDINGHGTHMAGIIAADGGPDGEGLYGFAPQASISAYRVCDRDGMCFSDDIAVAMNAAVDEGAQIIVLGLGGEAESSFIADALVYAEDHNVLVIAAAGNDGPYADSVDWPARNPLAVAVGAVDNTNTPADFSSRGTNKQTKAYQSNSGDIEFAAPGVNVESTFRDGGYAILSGTSMAAPHIAGLAVLLWQKDAKNPAQATRELLHDQSLDIGPAGDDPATGWGIPMMTTD